MQFAGHALEYGARIFSVIAVTIITLVMFNAIVGKVRVETRMRGYFLFILAILLTVMVIDLTALSTTAKTALEQGLSMGIGMAVGIFAIWFFFHEYLDKLLGVKPAPPKQESKPEKSQK